MLGQKLSQDTPSSIRQLLRHCLKKDARQRLQHIGDARIAIEEHLAHLEKEESEPTVSSHTAFSRKQKLFLGVTVLLTLLLGALLAGTLKPESPAPRPERLEENISGTEGLNTFGGNRVALSPDGSLLVHRAGTGQEPLRLCSLDKLNSEVMPGTEGGEAPFFSPYGRWVALSGRELRAFKKVSVTGGTPVTLCSTQGTVGGAWGPKGVVVFAGRRSLWQVSAAGGTPEELTQLEEEVAAQIAAALQTQLTSQDQQSLTQSDTRNAEAYQDFLKGLFYFNLHQAEREGLPKAIDSFKVAIERDPGYALAYSWLAFSYQVFAWTVTSSAEDYERARAALEKGIQIDENTALAHQMKADFLFLWERTAFSQHTLVGCLAVP